jgi:hypothetical protein
VCKLRVEIIKILAWLLCDPGVLVHSLVLLKVVPKDNI